MNFEELKELEENGLDYLVDDLDSSKMMSNVLDAYDALFRTTKKEDRIINAKIAITILVTEYDKGNIKFDGDVELSAFLMLLTAAFDYSLDGENFSNFNVTLQ